MATDQLLGRLDTSTDHLIDALRKYDSYAKEKGNKIVTDFLDRFRDPKAPFNEKARSEAAEAGKFILTFSGPFSNFFPVMAQLKLAAVTARNSVLLKGLKRSMTAMGQVPLPDPSVEPIVGLRNMMAGFSRVGEQFAAIKQEAETDDSEVVERLILIQDATTNVVVLRHMTLMTFAVHNVDKTISATLERILDLVTDGKSKPSTTHPWIDTAIKVVEITLSLHAPVLAAPKVVAKLQKLLTRTPEMKEGSTDLMQRLLSRLENENDLLSQLILDHDQTWNEFRKIFSQ
jgi:hypothetical protein